MSPFIREYAWQPRAGKVTRHHARTHALDSLSFEKAWRTQGVAGCSKQASKRAIDGMGV